MTSIMIGKTPVNKFPFSVYAAGNGNIDIVNRQRRRAQYTQSDLNAIRRIH